nr:hypothetical protein [Desulfuromonadales bacterium]
MRTLRFNIFFFGLILLLSACTKEQASVLEGRLMHDGEPLAGAQLEVYLKAEKDRSTLPFTTVVTGEDGRYSVQLPEGRYFLIGKKKVQIDGRARMLMAECPTNPVEAGGGATDVPSFSLQVMGDGGGLVSEPDTAVTGRLVHDDKPLPGGWVYVYTKRDLDLMGPSYGASAQAGDDGTFRIELPSGSFYLAGRHRFSGGEFGQPQAGDLNGVYAGNPVTVKRGEEVRIGDFALEPVDSEQQRRRLADGKFARTETAFVGEVQDEDGRPVPGVFVFAYLDSRMVGKPNFISAPTGQEGRFEIPLTDGGTYYIGARSSFGGPLEPGEWVGTYEGRPDHGVEVQSGQSRRLETIVVREVW